MSISLLGPIIILAALACGVLGIVLITLGFRGRAQFTAPHCAKCNYDLRAANYMTGVPTQCPECGVDLSQPKAVRFGRSVRRPRLIAVGILLLAMIFIGPALASYLLRSAMRTGPAANASKTNTQLLASLPAGVDQPWEWRELESRLNTGKLSNAEVDQAFAVLTAHLKTQQRHEPLHWSRDFLKAAIAANAVSPAALGALSEAYFGRSQFVRLSPRARQGKPIHLSAEHLPDWESGLFSLIWHLREVRVGDQVVGLRDDRGPVLPDLLSESQQRSRMRGHQLATNLPPGEHEIEMRFDVGVVGPGAVFRGFDGTPGVKEKWPATLATWETTQRQKIRVYAADEPMVTLVTDESRAPFAADAVLINGIAIRPGPNRRTPQGERPSSNVLINWNNTLTPATPIYARVTLRAAGEEFSHSQLSWTGQRSGTSEATTHAIPPEVTHVDIILTPNVPLAESNDRTTEMWATPIELKNIPLDRYDNGDIPH